jgi:hypothetical protein
MHALHSISSLSGHLNDLRGIVILLDFLHKLAAATLRAKGQDAAIHTNSVVVDEVPLARRAAKQEGGVPAPLARGLGKAVLHNWGEVRSTAYGAIMFAVRYEAFNRRGHCHHKIKIQHLICCNLRQLSL